MPPSQKHHRTSQALAGVHEITLTRVATYRHCHHTMPIRTRSPSPTNTGTDSRRRRRLHRLHSMQETLQLN